MGSNDPGSSVEEESLDWENGSSENESEYSDVDLEADEGVVEMEASRLKEVISVAKEGSMSIRCIEKLLKARPLCCKCSYQSIRLWMKKSSNVTKRSAPMCPLGHMIMESGDDKCKVSGCGMSPSSSRSHWHLSLVSQLQALVGKAESYDQIRRGQSRAVASLRQAETEAFSDYYDGSLFQSMHGPSLRQLHESGEVAVFLRMATDGFKLFQNRRKQRSAWPVAFTILNYDHKARFRSSNCLITSFVPGSHDSDHFDSFLRPAVDDLLRLERGVMAAYADGQTRKLRAHVVFFTGDMPAVAKVMGCAGRNATSPCRFCHTQ